VIEKDTPGPFGVTNIDHAFRMLGVDILVVTGVVTDQCVEATVRGAFDFGYQVILAEDACATVSADLHAASLRVLADWFCRVWTTAEVLEDLRRLREEV
jgi:ureidoacrylate peracid hydrolase